MAKDKRDPGRGYWDRILHVNLGSGSIRYEAPGEDVYRQYLGGLGLAAKVLWDRMVPGSGPLDPENLLGFTTGTLTDTGSLFTGRFTVVGKSPVTGGWGDANCGGYFSPFLKRCSIDALFLSGRSDAPVYLHLDGETAQLQDATDLWGRDTLETEAVLKQRHGKLAQVACIGPAGEGLSLMAGISTDEGRMAARMGLGAVMGSKNLKAVVAAGKQRVGVADGALIKALSRDFRARLERGNGLKRFISGETLKLMGRLTRLSPLYFQQPPTLFRLLLEKYGTPFMTVPFAECGDSPVKNWGGIGHTDFPHERSQRIGAEKLLSRVVKRYGCFACPLRCGARISVPEGSYPIYGGHRPEYESVCALGTLILHDDLNAVCYLNDLLNRAGMDTISCGTVIAFAVECFENGLLSARETGGLELRWGNSEAIVRLARMIVRREGVGDLLADGVKAASERIGRGSEAFAVHFGGVEPAMHDPKFDPGFGMTYLCQPTPGEHQAASYMLMDLERLHRSHRRAGKTPLWMSKRQKYRYTDKARLMAIGTFFRMLVDCAGACMFGTQVGGDLPLVQWLNAATGWNVSEDDYLVIGERVVQLRHAFNLREGLDPVRDVRMPGRVAGAPPMKKGPHRGVTLDPAAMRRSYYDAMGWDPETGMCGVERMNSLGLEEVRETLCRTMPRTG